MKSKMTMMVVSSMLFLSTLGMTEDKTSNKASKGSIEHAKDTALIGWKDLWPDGKSTGAGITAAIGFLTITGISHSRSYGSIYKRLKVDLNKTPYLTVSVDSVKGYWYLIAKNSDIKNGYVKIQTDTKIMGKRIYDLKAITGLDGVRDLELEIGISSGKSEPNLGNKMTVKKFAFSSKNQGIIPGALIQTPWQDKWPDNNPTGATIEAKSTIIHLKGNSNKKSYGTVYKVVSVDLDQTPFLRVTPESVNGYWYIEAIGGGLKSPVKIQTDSDLTATRTYELKNAFELSGVQPFEIHFGIGSGGEEPNQGKEVSFKEDIGFVSGRQN